MSLLKNAGFMSIAVFLSRLLGLVREQVFAYLFGAGLFADAYLVAFRVPNLFRDLFAEGALSSAFVAVFSKTPEGAERKELARKTLIALTVILAAVTMAIAFFAEPLVTVMAKEFRLVPDKFELTVRMVRILSPFLYFVSMAALAMGILNSMGSFFIPSMGAAAFNLGNIIVGGGAALWFSREGPAASILAFCVGTLVGGFCQWALQWPALIKRGFEPWRGLSGFFSPSQIGESFRDTQVRNVFHLMTPSIMAVAAVQVNVLVNTSFASGLGTGAVSWLNFAYRIMHFPMGVFGVALSTAALPQLSKLYYEKNMQSFSATLQKSFQWTLILALGSTAGLVFWGKPIVSLLYEHGRFQASDTEQTALALAAYACGLLAFNGTKICVQAFYAMNSIWLPSALSALAIITNYVGNSYFAPKFGHMGLAATTSLTSFLNMFLLMLALHFKKISVLNANTLRVFVACVLASASIWGLSLTPWVQGFTELRAHQGTTALLIRLIPALCMAGGAYLGVVALLTLEGRALLKRLSGRMGGRLSG